MSGSIGQPDGRRGAGGNGPGAAASGDPSPGAQPPPAPEAAEEAAPAPRPPPEPDDAAAALRLALNQLSVLGLGGAGDQDEEGAAAGSGDGVAAAARGADGGAAVEPTPPDGPEAGAPVVAVTPGPLPLLEPDVSPPPPRPSPPDVFASFTAHPAALGPPTLLAEQMSVIGSRKKSVNMTECVPVPSSEHVAEIVGRQGEWPPSGAQSRGSLRCCSGDRAAPAQPAAASQTQATPRVGFGLSGRLCLCLCPAFGPREKLGRSPRSSPPRSGPTAAFVWAPPARKDPEVQRCCGALGCAILGTGAPGRQANFLPDHPAVTWRTQDCSPLWPCLMVGTCPCPVLPPELGPAVPLWSALPAPPSPHTLEALLTGCKIKALRAKTNTYIKTPVRGEEPVFIVTGRQEDVEMAKREILSAAEHFSVIRATRSKAGGLPGTAQGPPNLPGQTTIQVRVPYRVVGLVVGPKGATIKRIQQRTHTYIVTPGRDKEPVDFHANGTDVCLDLLGAAAGLWAKAPNPGRRPTLPAASLRGDSSLGAPGGPEAFYPSSRGGPPVPDTGPASPYGGSGNGGFTFGGDGPGAPAGPPAPEDCDFGFDFLALDLTVPTAATIWAPFERAAPVPAFVNGAPAPPASGVRRSSGAGTPRHSPTLPEPGGLGLELPLARRGPPDPQQLLHGHLAAQQLLRLLLLPLDSSASDISRKPSAAATSGPGVPVASATPGPALVRECVVCAEGEVMAALVPCGHNLFCMDCAVRICGKSEPECPACRTPATQAIHIFS
ncbi:hypothetical protein QTO34_015709 [Cnephaeus nilssonii]|uniref:RING-type domain-containing protein n=1 Tax=Cnephaeus nilssonii TaxID=3371016 RepID=A0AA40I4U3_CNENI|nr:hypothetical protein QTO34_015709 [Eptesicus nilssonii]